MSLARYAVLFASMIMHLCLGGVYAWSALAPSLTTEHGMSTVQSQVVFGVMIAFLSLAMVVAGRLLPSLGPRKLAVLGGALLAAGYLMASSGTGGFGGLLIWMGILGGAGTGLAYVCPIAASVQWFPNRKGLVTGLTVCAFGAGGAAQAIFIGAAQNNGMTSMEILRWTGLVCGPMVVSAGMLLRFPPSPEHEHAQEDRVACTHLWAGRDFWMLALGMFGGTLAGLMVIGNLRGTAAGCGASQEEAVLAVSVFAAGNAAGRIFWGWIADRIGHTAAPLSLATLSGAVLLLAKSDGGMQVLLASALCGFGFGACFVVYAAQVSERFGIRQFGTVYPLVFVFYGLAGLAGPLAGGWLLAITESSRAPAAVAACIPGAAAAVWVVLARGRQCRQSRREMESCPVACPAHRSGSCGAPARIRPHG